jgi:ribosomal protein S18 acetylase RimI-like enzyme
MAQRLIRPAAASDAAAVAGLLGELGYPTETGAAGERLRLALASEQDGVLVSELDGRVVGLAAYQLFALIYRSRPQCRITALVVHSAARRRGVARGLVEEIESLARDAGCDRLELTTRPDRPEALHFYTALGFTDRPARLVKPLDRA